MLHSQSSASAPPPPPPLRVETKPRRSDGLASTLNLSKSTNMSASNGSITQPRSPAIAPLLPRGSARASTPHANGNISSSGLNDSHGSSDASTSKKEKDKRPRKKGWKGYAMQYFDDDGNLVEERIRDESPATEEKNKRDKAEADAAAAAVAAADALAASEAVAIEAKAAPATVNGSREASATRTIHSDPVRGKRVNTSLSPAPSLIKPIQPPNQEPDAGTSTKQTSARVVTEKEPPKKRRKTSPSSTPQPTDSRATSTAPRPTAKSKARSSLPNPVGKTARQIGIAANTAAVQAAQKLKEAKETAASAAPYIVEDDRPLPKVPRKGMGDGQADPAESDLRTIRDEATFIIASAEKHRQEMIGKEPMTKSGSIPYGQQLHSPPLTGAEGDIQQTPLTVAIPNGNHGASSYHTPKPTANGHINGDDISFKDSQAAGPSTSAPYRKSHVTTDEEFEAQFVALQDYYSDTNYHVMPVFADDPKPPKFHQGQKPSVVLAAPGGRSLARMRDKHERAYVEGFDGLPGDYEREIKGFIDNVRANMETVVQFYFNSTTLRRDAFIERLGRELSKLGSQLTDDGDAALLPRRSSRDMSE